MEEIEKEEGNGDKWRFIRTCSGMCSGKLDAALGIQEVMSQLRYRDEQGWPDAGTGEG